VTDSLQPYLYPKAHLGFLFITFFGELVFMLWGQPIRRRIAISEQTAFTGFDVWGIAFFEC